jgi:hypothetical protein
MTSEQKPNYPVPGASGYPSPSKYDPRIEDLDALLDAVSDQHSFLEFIAALGEDFALERELEKDTPANAYCAGILGWQNGSIDAFLSVAYYHGETMAKYVGADGVTNPWKVCAAILYAGKHFE